MSLPKVSLGAYESTFNSSSDNITDGGSFIGEWEERTTPDLIIAIASDVDLTYKIEFSTNKTDIDSTLSFQFQAGVIEQPHRITLTRKYFRVVVENDSGSDSTYMRLQVSLGFFNDLTTPLNGSVTQDHGAQDSPQAQRKSL